MLSAVLRGFVDFLYPKSAEVYALESLTPSELLTKLPPAKDLGDEVIALWSYPDSRVRELIWELKYRKNEVVTTSLAGIVYDVLKSEVAERALFENFANPMLIPMPISSKRRRERGWNQTEVLAEKVMELDREKLFEYEPHALERSHTESQTLTENKKERLRNVEGSMKTARDVGGRNVILLDDVTTTGATFKEAKRTLRVSGARRVLCIALAH